jgi:nucleoside 2-deoxyribosyltransferase
MTQQMIYIAGSFIDKHDIDYLKNLIEHETSFVVPCVWWNEDAKDAMAENSEEWYHLPIVRSFFLRDITFISACNIFVIKFPPSNISLLRGALVEMGIAFSKGKTIFAVGEVQRSCMFSVVDAWFDTSEELVKMLMEIDKTWKKIS